NDESFEQKLTENQIEYTKIGVPSEGQELKVVHFDKNYEFSVSALRDVWFKTSYLLDQKQSKNGMADERYSNYKYQPLDFTFPEHSTGKLPENNTNTTRPKAAIIREKGSNSEREMAHAMYLAGFDVKDVHMTDLISGRETLE